MALDSADHFADRRRRDGIRIQFDENFTVIDGHNRRADTTAIGPANVDQDAIAIRPNLDSTKLDLQSVAGIEIRRRSRSVGAIQYHRRIVDVNVPNSHRRAAAA